ncbi:MAG: RluA family pseudouridine synthase [Cyclobacteriaceae bacterium]|nr:RluA family pseudouridine synthase [Cyclobacteriaceae bacterium]
MSAIRIQDHILFEDEFILVLHKPAGLMVEPDRNGHPNLQQLGKAYLKTKLPKGEEVYLQHIHRLDRPVSGIILFAKQRSVLKNLSEQFAERKVKKFYQAHTSQGPGEMTGVLTGWLRKEKKKAVIYDEEIEFSEKVILNYKVRSVSKDKFLWNIELHTGKFHQIRAQLAYIGCPVIGDTVYGSDVPYRLNAIALNACILVFTHPTLGQEMSFEKYDL